MEDAHHAHGPEDVDGEHGGYFGEGGVCCGHCVACFFVSVCEMDWLFFLIVLCEGGGVGDSRCSTTRN